MRAFRNPFLIWLTEHPVSAVFALIGLAILLLALLPILLYMMPIRKVPLRYNLRNLQNRWKTTLVTALAFTFVTGLLTGMLSFVRGMDRLTESSGHPGNVLILSDGATDEALSNLPAFRVESLPRDLQKEVQKASDGKTYLFSQEVYVIVMYKIPNATQGSRERRFVQMRGLDKMEVAAAIHGVDLAVGAWPSPAGVRKIGNSQAALGPANLIAQAAAAQMLAPASPSITQLLDASRVATTEAFVDTALEIVIGHGVARTFGYDVGKATLEPGDTVLLGPRKWVVVGIMQEGGNSFGSEIWTRDLHVQQNFGRENSYCSYVTRTSSPEKAKLAVQELKNWKDRNVQAFTERDYYAKQTETSKQFSFAIYIVAGIMAIGGVLGVMNTMYAAISQRSKDIGVLRLMGYRRWQILVSFQLESLLIALFGGVLGCVLAYVLFDGTTVSSIMSSGAGGGGKSVVLRLSFDLRVFLFGLIFSLMMGAVGGFFPAISAMRLRPLESLR